MRGVNLAGAKLTRADLRDCDFSPLPLAANRSFPARLDKAILRAADLRGAKFAGATLAGIDLRDVTVDEELNGLDLADATLDPRLKARLGIK
jgi:uncharacterized protein YjbI with pentapeptide repeats